MVQWYSLVFATFFFGAFAVSKKDDPMGFKKATFAKCQKQWNVPEGAMNDLFFFRTVEGIKDHKCVMKCINEEYGIFDREGNIREEKIEESIKELFKDPNIHKEILGASAECLEKVEKSSDACIYAYDLCECFINHVKAKGITPHRQNVN